MSKGWLFMRADPLIFPEAIWANASDNPHLGGHLGEDKIKQRLQNHFWFSKLDSAVKQNRIMPTMLTTYVQNHKGATFFVKTSRSNVRNCGIRSFWHLCPLTKTYILVAQNISNRYPLQGFIMTTKSLKTNTPSRPINKTYFTQNIHKLCLPCDLYPISCDNGLILLTMVTIQFKRS